MNVDKVCEEKGLLVGGTEPRLSRPTIFIVNPLKVGDQVVVPVFNMVHVWVNTVRGIMGVPFVIETETNCASSPAHARPLPLSMTRERRRRCTRLRSWFFKYFMVMGLSR